MRPWLIHVFSPLNPIPPENIVRGFLRGGYAERWTPPTHRSANECEGTQLGRVRLVQAGSPTLCRRVWHGIDPGGDRVLSRIILVLFLGCDNHPAEPCLWPGDSSPTASKSALVPGPFHRLQPGHRLPRSIDRKPSKKSAGIGTASICRIHK